ncbi:hypothetical protein EV188_107231 [Actinomycetospora succinea]|uniref:Uncharacterized protein n=1 Tax=Actinomycetospora succinea TaxID=663603 RepID=A0A4V3D8R8_9PSEU|nr:hypothetical protein [Actinomycetospora succinea]TDQ52851.1 hypothetical protein EV188_107231 [Actinomycetospora succinea]
MALVVFAVVSVVVIGVPLYLAVHSWSGRSDRRAAEARRRASSAHPTTATGGRTRRVLAP